MSRATRQLGVLACPVGCGRTRAVAKLMCPACWRQVPKDLQDAVYGTLRIYNRAMLRGVPAEQQRAAYKEARAAAIGSVP